MRKTIVILALAAATPAVAQQQAQRSAKPPTAQELGIREFVLSGQPEACWSEVQKTSKVAPQRVIPLGAAPRARHERAVMRLVGGCMVPVIVNHNVERNR
ncbi:hypothetical protein GVN21_18670 [Caulobacter sp. SLTY]|uniref:hypothetical protein n=1 Tax=Caulobacter sp. SLTY TaxID=2683262 RepID=UPI0014130AF9|nr:hypothetical protein [Caulobacter sp. SLTY]NBB17391.1 hypothetical protein [Caulobacter sp. SLTY]